MNKKLKAFLKSRNFWTALLTVILILISVSLWMDYLRATNSVPPEPQTGTVSDRPAFRGPVGEPHIVGPNGPPPSP